MPDQFDENFVGVDDNIKNMARVGMALDRELNGNTYSYDLKENRNPSYAQNKDSFEPFFKETPKSKSINKHFQDFTMNGSLSTQPSVEKPRGRNMNSFEENSFNRLRNSSNLFHIGSPALSDPGSLNRATEDTSSYRNKFLSAFQRKRDPSKGEEVMLDESPSLLRKGLDQTPLTKRQNRNLLFDSPSERLPKKPETPWRKPGLRFQPTPQPSKQALKETPSSLKTAAKLMEQLDLDSNDVPFDSQNQTSYRLPNMTNLSQLVQDPATENTTRASQSGRLPNLDTVPIAETDEKLFYAHKALERKLEAMKQEHSDYEEEILHLRERIDHLTDAYNREKKRARSLEDRMSRELMMKYDNKESESVDPSITSRLLATTKEKEALIEQVKSLQEQYDHIQQVYKNVLLDRESYIMRLSTKVSENHELNNENQKLKERLLVLEGKENNTDELRDIKERNLPDWENNQIFRSETSGGRNLNEPKEVDSGLKNKESILPSHKQHSPPENQNLVKELTKEIEKRKALELKLLSLQNNGKQKNHRSKRVHVSPTTNKKKWKKGEESDFALDGESEWSDESDFLDTEDEEVEEEARPSIRRKEPVNQKRKHLDDYSGLVEDSYLGEEGLDWSPMLQPALNNTKERAHSPELPKHILDQVDHIINCNAVHKPEQCTVCHGRQQEGPAVSDLWGKNEEPLHPDVTMRPSQPPQKALKDVMEQLTKELMGLKKQYETFSKRYNSLTPEYHRRRRQTLKVKLIKILELMEKKSDQIYALHDIHIAETFCEE
ncbi:spindle pole body protein Ppc89 [Schizosaccharomyces cryophilus OY26]|uniref:Spindle pole body protein Ppc89 n=1 Tax=Schizosaccharomyces cryophilus (strain OY26 / ATCC MYA-4695 / CBS 11777 / NBRC 106824 / NRRL Y48691) TaxID=653667 RepID=S9VUR9_SCHCR|nr:spindle pole body protein Ppc89 [Schizosaccharomyces cryophilus OY26]EPY51543.1 spindle pole body protein Ppc89 [Schizosaccharomyces cryophilus OY26]